VGYKALGCKALGSELIGSEALGSEITLCSDVIKRAGLRGGAGLAGAELGRKGSGSKMLGAGQSGAAGLRGKRGASQRVAGLGDVGRGGTWLGLKATDLEMLGSEALAKEALVSEVPGWARRRWAQRLSL